MPGRGGKAVKQSGFVNGSCEIFGDDFVTERLMSGRGIEQTFGDGMSRFVDPTDIKHLLSAGTDTGFKFI